MSFWGYPRPDGSVGTRNYVGVIPTVACSCDVARQISENVNGCVPFIHYQGCDLTPTDIDLVNRTLANLGRNPNLAGVLLVSLGCEMTDVDGVLNDIALARKPVAKIVIQRVGGTSTAVAEGSRIARQMVSDALRVKREKFDDSKLIFGAECGSSDTTSGIGSNPAIGAAFDLLIKRGGSGVFSQTTEFIGAEHLLAQRAASSEVAHKIIEIVKRYEKRFLDAGVDMRGANPTKGNIQGGLTTIEEKSLGAIAKSGTAPIQQVYEYGERLEGNGLFIVDGPGNDPKSLTCLAAAGANVIFFSTGRGTPIGCPFVPVIKVTANHVTYERMMDNIDIYVDIASTSNLEESGRVLFEEALKVASGRKTRSEIMEQCSYNGIYVIGPLA
jgi:altronate dehydratase large subunit